MIPLRAQDELCALTSCNDWPQVVSVAFALGGLYAKLLAEKSAVREPGTFSPLSPKPANFTETLRGHLRRSKQSCHVSYATTHLSSPENLRDPRRHYCNRSALRHTHAG